MTKKQLLDYLNAILKNIPDETELYHEDDDYTLDNLEVEIFIKEHEIQNGKLIFKEYNCAKLQKENCLQENDKVIFSSF